MYMTKIIIRPEEGEGFTAFGQSAEDGEFYLTDAETLEAIVEKVIPYALEHGLTAAEIDLSAFPDFKRRAS